MEEMLGFRPVEWAIQSQAMISGLAKSILNIDVVNKHAPDGIIADVHMTHFPAISTDGYRKFLACGQTIIHPVCRIF